MKKVWTKTLVLLGACATALCALCPVSADEDGLKKVKERGSLIVTTSPDFAPMEFIDDHKKGQEQYVGSDMELARYIAEKLGVKLQIEAMDFDQCYAAVAQGKADLSIAAFSKTPEREENFHLSKEYSGGESEGEVLLCLKENAGKLKTKEDFKGKKVGAQNASLQQQVVSKELPEATQEPLSNVNLGIEMLLRGKIDALAIGASNSELILARYKELALCEFVPEYVESGYLVLLPKQDETLLKAVNEIIDEVNKKELYKKWKQEAVEQAKKLGVKMDQE